MIGGKLANPSPANADYMLVISIVFLAAAETPKQGRELSMEH